MGYKTRKKEFTPKQQAFIDFWDGNATEAAQKAGYSHPGQQGERLLKNVEIARAIKLRQIEKAKPHIASREDRQKFWSDMMNNKKVTEQARLKASELLGKSEGDFLDRVEHSGKIDIANKILEARKQIQ